MSGTMQVNIPQSTLIDAVSTLDTDQLEELVDQLLLIRAQRIAPSIASSEIELVKQIQVSSLSSDEQSRLTSLSNKLELDELSEGEHTELLVLSEKSEKLNVERVQLVGQLAIKRGQSLEAVLADLGLLITPNA